MSSKPKPKKPVAVDMTNELEALVMQKWSLVADLYRRWGASVGRCWKRP